MDQLLLSDEFVYEVLCLVGIEKGRVNERRRSAEFIDGLGFNPIFCRIHATLSEQFTVEVFMLGIRGISIGSIALVVAIIAIFFGTKRLRHVGEDVGAAIKGFKKGIQDESEAVASESQSDQPKEKE
jgi:sec-independent protein translocase protein TatA